MYYQSYEDYMRAVLGYPLENNYTYQPYSYMDRRTEEMPFNMPKYSDDIMNLYPEIYKIVNPMVCKMCENNTKPITQELIDKMVEEIYQSVEESSSTVVNLRINTPTPSNNVQNRNSTQAKKEVESKETRGRVPNRTLQDLIKILILNQLLGGGNYPNRPPYRPPMRPPYPRNYEYLNI